jgi:hypothetical protein
MAREISCSDVANTVPHHRVPQESHVMSSLSIWKRIVYFDVLLSSRFTSMSCFPLDYFCIDTYLTRQFTGDVLPPIAIPLS